LEVLGHDNYISHACCKPTDWSQLWEETGRIHTGFEESFFKITAPPQILENGRASTIYSAVEAASQATSVASLKKASKDVAVVIVSDCPDNCSANKRLKKATAEAFSECPNVFYDELAGCLVHILVGLSFGSTGEKDLIGHAHAVMFCFGVHSKRQQLLVGLREFLEEKLEVIPGPPPEHFRAHTEQVLQQTMLREEKAVRARIEQTELEGMQSSRGATKRAMAPALQSMINGDIRARNPQHWCSGCCVDSEGNSSREVSVDRSYAAIVGSGMFGGLGNTDPAKNKMWSVHFAFATILLGMLFNMLAPQVWERVFGGSNKWEDIKKGKGGADEDFHILVRSKIYRALLFLTRDMTQTVVCAVTLVTAPLNHLAQRLQHLDVVGGILREIKSPRNPFDVCIRTLVDMLLKPMLTVLALFFHHFDMNDTAAKLRCLIMNILGKLWWVAYRFLCFPYRFIEMVQPGATHTVRENVSKALFDCKKCCLDQPFSWKVLTICFFSNA